MDWKTRTVVIGFGRLQKTVCRWIQVDTELHQSIRFQSDNIRRWKVASFPSTSLWLRFHDESAVSHSITDYQSLSNKRENSRHKLRILMSTRRPKKLPRDPQRHVLTSRPAVHATTTLWFLELHATYAKANLTSVKLLTPSY